MLTVLLNIGPSYQLPSGNVVLVWTLSTAVADATITVCMMVMLYHAKANSHFGPTRDKLSSLIRLTIQTGLLTSALAIPIAPLFIDIQVGIYTLTCFLLGKSYAISLLANLNARSSTAGSSYAKEDGSLANPGHSTIRFVSGQGHNSRDIGSRTGVLSSFIRSIRRSSGSQSEHRGLELSVGNGANDIKLQSRRFTRSSGELV